VLFALVLDALDRGATAEEALAGVIARTVEQSEAFLNLMVHDGQVIVATTWRNSLSVLRDEGLATGGVLVASEPLDDDPGWVDVPDHSIVRASCTELEISPLSAHGGPT
jgi:glutamine amidotransferase